MIDRFDEQRARSIQRSVDFSAKLLGVTKGEMPEPYIPVADAIKLREDEDKIVGRVGAFFLKVLTDPKVIELRKKYHSDHHPVFSLPTGLEERAGHILEINCVLSQTKKPSYVLKLSGRREYPYYLSEESVLRALQKAVPGEWNVRQEEQQVGEEKDSRRVDVIVATKKFSQKDLVGNRALFLAFVRGVDKLMGDLWSRVLEGEVKRMSVTEEEAAETQALIETCREALKTISKTTSRAQIN